ncbi:MAG: POTRA domain-containing protein [Ignavibacteria bacterium]
MSPKFYIYFFLVILTGLNSFSSTDTIPNRLSDSTEIKRSSGSNDSLINSYVQHPELLDSLKLKIRAIIISGNSTTQDYIIIREMALKENGYFTVEGLQQSILNIYNLRLFLKVDILPIPVSTNEIILNVDVKERWYIFPLPQAGMEDGEWSKKWLGLNLLWSNFRGRNETLLIQTKFLYNPSISAYYTVPWIGDNLHLGVTGGIGYSKTRNQSLLTLGEYNGTGTLSADEPNFDNIRFFTQLSLAKYYTRSFNIFTELDYNYLRVTQYAINRTISPTGKDKYAGIGFGINLDQRNIIEYSTRGYYLRTSYTRYGFIDKDINYGIYNFEGQSYIPFVFSKNFFITLASRIFTSLSAGNNIPYYNHVYLGYGDDYVRGWLKKAYEGEDKLTFYNEIRIPILNPRYINSGKLPVIKNMPFISDMELRHGLYGTIIFDAGSIWNKYQKFSKVRFMSGAGIGLNAVLPFGYVCRLEWSFPLTKPSVGQVVATLNAKF